MPHEATFVHAYSFFFKLMKTSQRFLFKRELSIFKSESASKFIQTVKTDGILVTQLLCGVHYKADSLLPALICFPLTEN